jgi:hypothetical protein
MKVIRSNLLHYLHQALQNAQKIDRFHGPDFKSIHTSAIEDTIEAVENGEQLEIVD